QGTFWFKNHQPPLLNFAAYSPALWHAVHIAVTSYFFLGISPSLDGGLSLPLFTQTSEAMRKITSGSGNGAADPLKGTSVPVVRLTKTDAIEKESCAVPKLYCLKCGKKFSSQSSLNKHARIHTGEKRFCCSECGKHFFSRWQLVIHTRFHTGEKPYGCFECNKRFTNRSSLQMHRIFHSGEKPHHCSQCDKRFATISHLRIHTRRHTGEKPYGCSECGKQFFGQGAYSFEQKREKVTVQDGCGLHFLFFYVHPFELTRR
uniref:Zinc finger protein 883-like n=1 Tax=Erpetoichthys calabaricus TaxID=27687 RepID=A0A8C4RM67_ERPCA